MKYVPYSAIYVDITFSFMFKNAFESLKSQNVKKAISGIESLFIQDPNNERLLITTCVRGALDLALQALNYPPGTEILMSSLNIPDMVKVVRYHGLVPIPIDLDLSTMKPKYESLEKNISPKTKAIILAWVYGSYNYADEIYKLCKSKGIFIIEDNAETFFDLNYNGNSLADMSLFSFGTIKLNTALGGAVTIIRKNEVLFRKMSYISDKYPVEPPIFFFKRIFKAMLLILALNNTIINGYGRQIITKLGIEYKEKAIGLARGFQPHEDFLQTFRKRLPNSMVMFIYLRLKSYDKPEFLRGTQRQLEGQKILEKNGIILPGTKSERKFYWLFPVIVPDKELVYTLLNKKGIDAYKGATQLKPIPAPVGSKYIEPEETNSFFNNILYLPIHKNVPLASIQRICKEVVETVKLVEGMNGKVKGNGLHARL